MLGLVAALVDGPGPRVAVGGGPRPGGGLAVVRVVVRAVGAARRAPDARRARGGEAGGRGAGRGPDGADARDQRLAVPDHPAAAGGHGLLADRGGRAVVADRGRRHRRRRAAERRVAVVGRGVGGGARDVGVLGRDRGRRARAAARRLLAAGGRAARVRRGRPDGHHPGGAGRSWWPSATRRPGSAPRWPTRSRRSAARWASRCWARCSTRSTGTTSRRARRAWRGRRSRARCRSVTPGWRARRGARSRPARRSRCWSARGSWRSPRCVARLTIPADLDLSEEGADPVQGGRAEDDLKAYAY